MPPRLLFVSKPIGPPYQDGTKCLVRDIALHLNSITPVVMTSRGSAPFSGFDGQAGHIVSWPVYASPGRYQPGLGQNLRAVWSLLSGADADLWHFIFAPNPKSSMMGSWLKRARGVPALQTVASPPRRFENPERLLFGDIVVAQSTWTEQRLRDSFTQAQATPPRLEVIPPPVSAVQPRTREQATQARQRLGIDPDVPLFVYPGDLEVSGGAEAVRRLVLPLRERIPGAVVVFAYRAKTEEAPLIAARLEESLEPSAARVSGDVPDILSLIAAASAVLFPVDDLWGKVDLPIVLLESMMLGVPVLALDEGPLKDLEGVVKLRDTEVETLLEAVCALQEHPEQRQLVIEEQKSAVQRRHRAEVVSRAYEKLYTELLTQSRAYSLER